MPLGADLGIFAMSLAAGLVGALAGVGGGLFVVPALTLAFGVDIHLAIGASIVSVIATSSGSAAAYVRDRMTDLHIGMFLELATTTGAIGGALLASVVAPGFLFVVLGLVLLGSGGLQLVRLADGPAAPVPSSPRAPRRRLCGPCPNRNEGRPVASAARRIPVGFALMGSAG